MAEVTPVERFGYEQTLMHGRYMPSMGDYAKDYARKLKYQEEHDHLMSVREMEQSMRSYSAGSPAWWSFSYYWRKLQPLLVTDYSFLLLLGILMALTAFVVDYVIDKCQRAHVLLYELANVSPLLQYFAWIMFPLALVTFAVGLCHLVAPEAIGSGIPEMKVILRGVVLSRFLSFQAYIVKTIGLMAALGSRMVVGKEGPFIHIACMLARSLSKFVTGFKGIYVNETRNTDMLACACALGVSSSFAAPIGGVLFSVEVTATYFAVRNYWRGFFTAVCGALTFRLLAVIDADAATVTAVVRTSFNRAYPFDVQELVAFAFIGLTCGLGGAAFVYLHRQYVHFNKRNETTPVYRFLTKSRFIFPAVIVILVSTLNFPKGPGMFNAGQLSLKEALQDLFHNATWILDVENPQIRAIRHHWESPYTNIYIGLILFIISRFFMTIVCIALPIPCGVFIPTLVLGAAYGRLVGESMAFWFPEGLRSGDVTYPVLPGGYAVVGAAAMSGAVTGTVSTAVIVFEMTGQITHILPVLVATIIANAVMKALQPSIFDSIIVIKKLPYLPDVTRSANYNVTAGDIMNPITSFVTTHSTYMQVRHLLQTSRDLSFALVDQLESMVLLGSIRRQQLEWLLQRHIVHGAEARSNPSGRRHGKGKGRFDHRKLSQPVSLQHVFLASLSEAGKPTAVDTLSDARVIPAWEIELLEEVVDFTDCLIDPAPFQLVEQTTLYKVHKMFCLMNLTQAYVTAIGRLVGVVTLEELRLAIEDERPYLERRLKRLQMDARADDQDDSDDGDDDDAYDDSSIPSSDHTPQDPQTLPLVSVQGR